MKPDYIWLFDDDVESLPEALETLYREMKSVEGDRRVGVLRAMIKDPQTGEMSGGGISIGGLIRPEMVADVGLPRSELFIELSDHHYSVMMRRRGWEILRVPVVLATHPVDKVKSLREIMAEGYRAKPWRLYYAVRNRIYFALYMQHAPLRTVRHLGLAARLIALLTIFGRPRRGQLLVLRGVGVVDGFRGRLGRRVEPGY
jgi:GT2 family glycosyltransferase